MGEWEEFCIVCAGPSWVSFDDMTDEQGQPLTAPPPNPADYTWLESFVGVSNKEELIPLADYNGYGSFDIQADESPYSCFTVGCLDQHNILDEEATRGFACHVTCYNLLQQELHYTLKYADVMPLSVNNNYCDENKFSWSDYGGLAEYEDQGLFEAYLVKDGKVWMIEDPSRNEENKERILRVWRPLVESGFKRPEANRSGAPKIAERIGELNLEESKA